MTDTTTTYSVAGMSCEHCVAAVSGGIARISGVTGVSVDLDSGQVAVTSGTELATAAVAAAVDEAGYELTS